MNRHVLRQSQLCAERELVGLVPAQKVENPEAVADSLADGMCDDHGARRERGVAFVVPGDVEAKASPLAIQKCQQPGDRRVPIPQEVQPQAPGLETRPKYRAVLSQLRFRELSPAPLPEFEQDRDLQLAVLGDARPPQSGNALHRPQIVADLSAHPWTRTGAEVGLPAVVELEEWTRSGGVPFDPEPRLGKVAEKGI